MAVKPVQRAQMQMPPAFQRRQFLPHLRVGEAEGQGERLGKDIILVVWQRRKQRNCNVGNTNRPEARLRATIGTGRIT